MLKHVPWYTERSIHEITLGGLIVLVVIRTIQFNMTRMRVRSIKCSKSKSRGLPFKPTACALNSLWIVNKHCYQSESHQNDWKSPHPLPTFSHSFYTLDLLIVLHYCRLNPEVYLQVCYKKVSLLKGHPRQYLKSPISDVKWLVNNS